MATMTRRQRAVVKLDSLNLIEAVAEDDRGRADGIMALYRDAHSLSVLAWYLSFAAAELLNAYRRVGGKPDLAGLRADFLSQMDA
jgi:hypothetical protein